jgi:hypothetical protein
MKKCKGKYEQLIDYHKIPHRVKNFKWIFYLHIAKKLKKVKASELKHACIDYLKEAFNIDANPDSVKKDIKRMLKLGLLKKEDNLIMIDESLLDAETTFIRCRTNYLALPYPMPIPYLKLMDIIFDLGMGKEVLPLFSNLAEQLGVTVRRIQQMLKDLESIGMLELIEKRKFYAVRPNTAYRAFVDYKHAPAYIFVRAGKDDNDYQQDHQKGDFYFAKRGLLFRKKGTSISCQCQEYIDSERPEEIINKEINKEIQPKCNELEIKDFKNEKSENRNFKNKDLKDSNLKNENLKDFDLKDFKNKKIEMCRKIPSLPPIYIDSSTHYLFKDMYENIDMVRRKERIFDDFHDNKQKLSENEQEYSLEKLSADKVKFKLLGRHFYSSGGILMDTDLLNDVIKKRHKRTLQNRRDSAEPEKRFRYFLDEIRVITGHMVDRKDYPKIKKFIEFCRINKLKMNELLSYFFESHELLFQTIEKRNIRYREFLEELGINTKEPSFSLLGLDQILMELKKHATKKLEEYGFVFKGYIPSKDAVKLEVKEEGRSVIIPVAAFDQLPLMMRKQLYQKVKRLKEKAKELNHEAKV